MARNADCRLCAFFTPVEEMSEPLLAYARRWLREKRPGAQLLGWCNTYRRPVTYYVGSCFRYTPRTEQPLTKWMRPQR